ncbi:uncharacterized protein CEXT_572071 [Caerostris extrusa]|uniref:Uncharacterized protein n=1 Tax=Caerostris extrusa TaxID=172846 RepID=A0AAV4Q174_CAEEX|nr:uncharacterized protein CEXT_572071 [Caerostris extrusa]
MLCSFVFEISKPDVHQLTLSDSGFGQGKVLKVFVHGTSCILLSSEKPSLLGSFSQSSSKNGFNSFDLNNLLDPPSKLSFKHKDILDYMDREIDKLSQKAAFISDYEGIGYKEYTDTLLTSEKIKTKQKSEAESNNHVSHVDPTDGYNLQSPEVIVKELGNRAPNSAGYQDKVVYIPVYDSSNSQSGKMSIRNILKME